MTAPLVLDESGSRLWSGRAGPQELLVDLPAGPWVGVVVVTHPQPLLGGHAMHKVPQALARSLCEAGWAVVRPNFRGVGRSTGVHDEGVGETEDVLDLCAAIRGGHPGVRLDLVGFSFGAFVIARVAKTLEAQGLSASRVGLLGMPSGEIVDHRAYDPPQGIANALVLHGELDERVPLQAVIDWARADTQPVVVVPGADHFFTGHLPLMRSLVLRHLRS